MITSMARTPNLVHIVDDDAFVRRALARVIKSFGFEVQVFSSAHDYLQISDTNRAACLVLDVVMPAMNGFELCKLLKKLDQNVPTLLMSTHANEEHAKEALSVGAVAFLPKPCEESLLLEAIDKAIGQKL